MRDRSLTLLLVLGLVVVASGCVSTSYTPAQEQIDDELQVSHNKLFKSMTFDNETDTLTWTFEDEPVMVGEYSTMTMAGKVPVTHYYNEDYTDITIQQTRLEHTEEITQENLDGELDIGSLDAGTYNIEVLASKTSESLLGGEDKQKYKQEFSFAWNGTHINYVNLEHAEEEWR